jgi:hypothetical protein
MPFFEVKQELLQKENKDLIMRFFMDTKNNTNLHIWTDPEGNMERFQLSNPMHIIEWKRSSGFLTGNLDDGESKVGFKASPIMKMDNAKDQQMVKKFVDIIQQALKLQSAGPIGSVLTFVLKKISPESITDS